MAQRILITSGPTRQHLDPVRYLTNASSGRMGAALAEAALARGHEVVIVSGPVSVAYPPEARTVGVISTSEMMEAAAREFASCQGLIGAAAPCDYQPRHVAEGKIAKTGQPLRLELIETPDIVATLAAEKGSRWVVGFALETDDPHLKALAKLQKKRCDLIVLNGPQAMDAEDNQVEIIDAAGDVVAAFAGDKRHVARGILSVVDECLIRGSRKRQRPE